jgi:hypothetical protein
MIKFDLAVDIYRPLPEVFVFVVTPENDFHWQYGTLTSTQISKGEIGTGTLFRAVGHFMGRRTESMYEVTEFESNKKYGFKSQSSSLAIYTLYTFELIKGRTRVNVVVQVDSGGTVTASDTVTQKRSNTGKILPC